MTKMSIKVIAILVCMLSLTTVCTNKMKTNSFAQDDDAKQRLVDASTYGRNPYGSEWWILRVRNTSDKPIIANFEFYYAVNGDNKFQNYEVCAQCTSPELSTVVPRFPIPMPAFRVTYARYK